MRDLLFKKNRDVCCAPEMMPESTRRIDYFSSRLVLFFLFILAAQASSAASTLHILERLRRMAVLRPQGPISSVEAIAQMHMDRKMQAYGYFFF